MKTINGNCLHRHRWRKIGAHTLHAGRTKEGYVREVREVRICACKEVRVSIRHEVARAFTDDQRQALATEHNRVPGQSAVWVLRRKKYEVEKVPNPEKGRGDLVRVVYLRVVGMPVDLTPPPKKKSPQLSPDAQALMLVMGIVTGAIPTAPTVATLREIDRFRTGAEAILEQLESVSNFHLTINYPVTMHRISGMDTARTQAAFNELKAQGLATDDQKGN